MFLNFRSIFPSKPSEELSAPAFTKDWDMLNSVPGHLFFEYGEFKKGFPCHDLLETPPRTHAYTVHRQPLLMWNDHQASFPMAMDFNPTSHPIRKARIAGELYLLPTEKIPHLDNYRQNGVQFLRKKVAVQLPQTQQIIKAFAYVGNKEYWQPQCTWAENFFRGRERSAFSIIDPICDARKFKHWWLGFHSTFTRDHFKELPTRCYIGLYPNGVTVPQEPPPPIAPTVQDVRIV